MRSLILLSLTSLTALLANAQSISTSGHCGASFGGLTCAGSSFGSCCSQHNWCGSTAAHCTEGCQSGFGTCN
ncbi:carbohydrate-binding module family 18 protein, partial [Cucurbitaria berberidis CBS 394.84]